jgi:hypothetical protein
LTERPKRIRRSELFTPRHSTKVIAKAADSDADLVFLDLEDAVAPSAKPEVRRNIVAGLNDLDWGTTCGVAASTGPIPRRATTTSSRSSPAPAPTSTSSSCQAATRAVLRRSPCSGSREVVRPPQPDRDHQPGFRAILLVSGARYENEYTLFARSRAVSSSRITRASTHRGGQTARRKRLRAGGGS